MRLTLLAAAGAAILAGPASAQGYRNAPAIEDAGPAIDAIAPAMDRTTQALLNLDLGLIEELLPLPSKRPDYRKDRSHAEFLVNLGSIRASSSISPRIPRTTRTIRRRSDTSFGRSIGMKSTTSATPPSER